MFPVIRVSSQEETLAVADAVAAGSIDIIELTMTVPSAAKLTAEQPELLFGADLFDLEAVRVGNTAAITGAARKYVSIIAEART